MQERLIPLIIGTIVPAIVGFAIGFGMSELGYRTGVAFRGGACSRSHDEEVNRLTQQVYQRDTENSELLVALNRCHGIQH